MPSSTGVPTPGSVDWTSSILPGKSVEGCRLNSSSPVQGATQGTVSPIRQTGGDAASRSATSRVAKSDMCPLPTRP